MTCVEIGAEASTPRRQSPLNRLLKNVGGPAVERAIVIRRIHASAGAILTSCPHGERVASQRDAVTETVTAATTGGRGSSRCGFFTHVNRRGYDEV